MGIDTQTAIDAIVKSQLPIREELLTLLKLDDDRFLYAAANKVRERCMGSAVHLRGIIEFSNHCARNCLYCGLRRDNHSLQRYRMTPEEIVDTAGKAAIMGLRTIVLQSGEDPRYTVSMLAEIVGQLKDRFDVAVTLSVGDRPRKDYKLFREAGADRYLLKHETADTELFARLRPGTHLVDRIKRLHWLKELGFQVGAGIMIGLPGQTTESLIDDLLLMRELDVEMAGIGPFIPHPHTPLGQSKGGTVDLTLKALALTRLLLPYVHLPATTALATVDPQGRERALAAGANVVMPDVTPSAYKKFYDIYPGRSLSGDPDRSVHVVSDLICGMGRSIATDHGHSAKPASENNHLKRNAYVHG